MNNNVRAKVRKSIFNWIDENPNTHRTHTCTWKYPNVDFERFLLQKSIASEHILPVIQCVAWHRNTATAMDEQSKLCWPKRSWLLIAAPLSFAIRSSSVCSMYFHLALKSIVFAFQVCDTSLNYNLIDGQWTKRCEIFAINIACTCGMLNFCCVLNAVVAYKWGIKFNSPTHAIQFGSLFGLIGWWFIVIVCWMTIQTVHWWVFTMPILW